MGKEEEGARAAGTDSSSRKRKALCLEPTKSRWASQQEDVSSSEQCKHFSFTSREMYEFLKTIKSFKRIPECKACWREATDRQLTLLRPKPRFVTCSGCSQCFCAGLAGHEDGPMGHARLHATSACHPVVLWIDQPDAGYCFQCDHSLSLKPITLAARSHKHGYVVRGMPNCRDKCYVNALVQCLLALDDLWMLMLGPHAPAGSLGLALKELFLETRAGNDHDAGATLNTEKLLECTRELDERYMTSDHQDCQEFLAHLRNGLIEEELQKRLPDVQKDAPTVVDSIFKGEVSRCLHTSDEGFYELPLTLPPEEHPIETAALPQKIGTFCRAVLMDNLQRLWKQEEQKQASLPSIEKCLEYYFRKEVVLKRCESCEKPYTSLSKDDGQMAANINESTSVYWDNDHSGKADEKSDLLSAHDTQSASTLNQDRMKQVELEKTANQVGEGQNKQIEMGVAAHKACFLSKLPPVLTLHVLRFKNSEKRTEHVNFEENLDVGDYLDLRSEDKDKTRYRLVGVIEHIGSSIAEGRCIAYVRGSRIASEQEPSSSPSSSWFCADDDTVTEVCLDEVLNHEAFLLFYERIED